MVTLFLAPLAAVETPLAAPAPPLEEEVVVVEVVLAGRVGEGDREREALAGPAERLGEGERLRLRLRSGLPVADTDGLCEEGDADCCCTADGAAETAAAEEAMEVRS